MHRKKINYSKKGSNKLSNKRLVSKKKIKARNTKVKNINNAKLNNNKYVKKSNIISTKELLNKDRYKSYNDNRIQQYDYYNKNYKKDRKYRSHYRYKQVNNIRNKKIKNRNLMLFSKTFTSIIFTMIIFYFVIFTYISLSKNPIEYETILYGSIDDNTNVKGIIIREEKLYKASKDGAVSFEVADNEKVKKGAHIVSIKNQELLKDTEKELEEINKKILEIQSKREDLSLFSEDVKKINLQIEGILNCSIYELSMNNMTKIYEIKDYISKKMNIRNQMLLSENGGSIQELSNQKVTKELKINENKEKIFASEGGVVSYYTDGLEETFNFDSLDTLTKEQIIMSFKSMDKERYKISVLEGEPVFKIVTNNEFYIASYVKEDNIDSFKQGDRKNIYIKDSGKLNSLEVIIEKINPLEKGNYVLMKSTNNIIDFIDKRSITFEISKPKDGFKITKTAIAEENLLKIPLEYIDNEEVIKKIDNTNLNIYIQKSGEDENGCFALVPVKFGVLTVGDTIVHPKTKAEYQLRDIFTTKGIYVINSGIYNFRRINMDNSIQNDEFVILDPSLNLNIRIYDRFIPDAKSVQNKERL